MSEITIVSGLPRSGTSMMMKMLEAGGLDIFQDGVRRADDDNPKGYYEYEKVKDLNLDASWLHEAQGKVIKIISTLLRFIPANLSYKIIFMQRSMPEILASQKKMLERSGEPPGEITDAVMAAKFSMHLRKIKKILAEQDNFETLFVNYSEMIANPIPQATGINRFLGGEMDIDKMIQIVDKNLYRNKG
jgi:hypothetical protein